MTKYAISFALGVLFGIGTSCVVVKIALSARANKATLPSDNAWCGVQNGVVECEKRYLIRKIV